MQARDRVRELTGRSWGCGWNTGCKSWGNACDARRRTSVSANTTGQCPNWTIGSDGESACATGNSGAGCAPRSSTCWPWAGDCGSESACADLDSPKRRSCATPRPARLSLNDGDPAWRQQQELLAHGENPSIAAGTVQRVVESARAGQRERAVVQGPGLHHLKEPGTDRFVERADLAVPPTADPHGGWCGAGG